MDYHNASNCTFIQHELNHQPEAIPIAVVGLTLCLGTILANLLIISTIYRTISLRKFFSTVAVSLALADTLNGCGYFVALTFRLNSILTSDMDLNNSGFSRMTCLAWHFPLIFGVVASQIMTLALGEKNCKVPHITTGWYTPCIPWRHTYTDSTGWDKG